MMRSGPAGCQHLDGRHFPRCLGLESGLFHKLLLKVLKKRVNVHNYKLNRPVFREQNAVLGSRQSTDLQNKKTMNPISGSGSGEVGQHCIAAILFLAWEEGLPPKLEAV